MGIDVPGGNIGPFDLRQRWCAASAKDCTEVVEVPVQTLIDAGFTPEKSRP